MWSWWYTCINQPNSFSGPVWCRRAHHTKRSCKYCQLKLGHLFRFTGWDTNFWEWSHQAVARLTCLGLLCHVLDLQDMLLSEHCSTFRQEMKWVLRKKMAIEYTCQGEPVVNWYPLQGELVTLLDASCFCQDRSKACHWSVVSFQATPFLGNGMDFMYTCEFWSSGLTETMGYLLKLQIFIWTLSVLYF